MTNENGPWLSMHRLRTDPELTYAKFAEIWATLSEDNKQQLHMESLRCIRPGTITREEHQRAIEVALRGGGPE